MKIFFLAALWLIGVAGSGLAQTTNTPPLAGGSTNVLSVRLWFPRTQQPFHAPATIRLFAHLASTAPGHPGETVRVDFFADDNLLGSGKAVWHVGMHPDPHSLRPQPMIVSLPGFSLAMFLWSNAPAGTHVLTARAEAAGGVEAISSPETVKILP